MCENEGMRGIPCEDHFKDYKKVLENRYVEMVIICTPMDSLAEITIAALRAGKHVLVEKPAARNVAELQAMAEEEGLSGKHVRVGFNLRYHRAIRKAFEIVGEIGPLLFVRARYGHGGRKDYEKEWRMRAGAGELLDQGVHLIDLAQAFLGPFDKETQGEVLDMFWKGDTNDNAFLTLRTKNDKIAFLHAGYTEWKNLFCFEIAGRQGKIEISGLGGSYGVERCTLYKMLPQMGPPETTTWEYPMADDSMEVELAAFLEDIKRDRTPTPGIAEAAEVLRVIENIK
jgi:predicted dehydrogenase